MGSLSVNRPLHGLRFCFRRDPTDKSVGYYHSSAGGLVELLFVQGSSGCGALSALLRRDDCDRAGGVPASVPAH